MGSGSGGKSSAEDSRWKKKELTISIEGVLGWGKGNGSTKRCVVVGRSAGDVYCLFRSKERGGNDEEVCSVLERGMLVVEGVLCEAGECVGKDMREQCMRIGL